MSPLPPTYKFHDPLSYNETVNRRDLLAISFDPAT